MDRGNILSGAAFTTALASALVFMAVLTVTGIAAYSYIQNAMIAQIEEQVRAEELLLADIFRDEGERGLVEAIAQLDAPIATPEHAIGVFDTAGRRLAGNISLAPSFVGWSRESLTVTVQRLGTPRTASYHIHASRLGRSTLVVGRSLAVVNQTLRALFRVFALAGFVVVLAMLTTGYLLSGRSLRKLERLEATLERVSAGDTDVRLPVSPQNDQIDRVARRMNAHLDRLSELMEYTRSTAAAIAHDLKRPLGRAYLGLERALDEMDGQKDPRGTIEDVQSELTKLTRIFDTMLRIARIGAQDGKSGLSNVALGPLVDDLVETYSAIASEKDQTLSVSRTEGEAFTILGDSAMLQQMIVNLLQNAVTHCPPGTEIKVTLEEGDGVVLCVSDTGPGIPAAERSKVFDAFYRLDRARTDEGSGLGLSLVRTIAERHGAEIELADNAPGLRVVVRFPARDSL